MMILLSLLTLIAASSGQNVTLDNGSTLTPMMRNGSIDSDFDNNEQALGCQRAQLYIYPDSTRQSYHINSQGIIITELTSEYMSITYKITCSNSSCQVRVNNDCEGDGTDQINFINVNTDTKQKMSYLVQCAPDEPYKPFEWGLLILVIFSCIAVALSSFFSRAWSYHGIGFDINPLFIVVFNAVFIVGGILVYFAPEVVSMGGKVIGSILGTIGVMVAFSETVWLFRIKKLNQKLFFFVRILDVISFLVGVVIMAVYWITSGIWIVNDILAVSTIVASIKLLKIRSLKIGLAMLVSLLVLQIIAGLLVHYVIETSYNNLVIKFFQSPIVVVFPSITPELYRRCAWLPVTSFIFPGLLISYLRRFDVSRSTYLYLLIGCTSFMVGSILWIFVDMATSHSLPFAILSQPVTLLGVVVVSLRRNELETLWSGMFFDPELPDVSENLLLQEERPRLSTSHIHELAENLRVYDGRSSEISDT